MIEPITLAVLKPLVTKLTEDFLARRRNKVAISELQDQVLRLLMSQRELQFEVTQARMAVVALTRYLALTQAETFVLHRDRLELAIEPPDHRQAVIGHAIEDFNSSVEARLQRQSSRMPRQRPVSSLPAKAVTSDVQNASPDALSRFFDDFDEEIMRTRLGREERND